MFRSTVFRGKQGRRTADCSGNDVGRPGGEAVRGIDVPTRRHICGEFLDYLGHKMVKDNEREG